MGTTSSPVPLLLLTYEKSVNETSEAFLRFSSIYCVSVNNIDQDLAYFVQRTNVSARLILIVLYQDKEVKQKSKQLQEILKLEKHQVICKAMEEENFSIVQDQLKTSIQVMMQMGIHKTSLLSFVMQTKKDEIFDVDDRRCYIGYMAAQSILKDVDKYNAKKERSAKAIILPCHSDLKCRQEIAEQDKELCRQEKLVDSTIQDDAFKVKKIKMEDTIKSVTHSNFRYLQVFPAVLIGIAHRGQKVLSPVLEARIK